MKYIRTKKGGIIDLEKFINKEKNTPYYTDFIFDEITKDGHLKWTAVGTDKNTMENQRGRRCQFGATLNSEITKQADTIEELCDELVFDNVYHSRMTPSAMHTKENQEVIKSYLKQNIVCYGAIWTSKGLIYVAKMNDEGELELL